MTIPQIHERLESCRHTAEHMQSEMELTLNTLTSLGFAESTVEIVKWGFGQRLHKVNVEIGALKKKLGIPSQRDLKLAKKSQAAAMAKLPKEVQTAMWGTYGKDGKGPLRNVRLVDCSSEHLGMILAQIAHNPYHPYVSYIKQILLSR